MAFEMNVNTDNAAFANGEHAHELARILRKLATDIESDCGSNDGGYVYDANGNKVGDWWIEIAEGAELEEVEGL